MVFLKATEHGELLLSLLHDNICQLQPGSTNGSSVGVSLPLQPGPRCVSVLGLLLLAYTEGQGQGPTILTVKMVLGPGTHTVTAQGVGLLVGEEPGNRIFPSERGPPASLLGALACLVSLQEEPVFDLEVTSTPLLALTFTVIVRERETRKATEREREGGRERYRKTRDHDVVYSRIQTDQRRK